MFLEYLLHYRDVESAMHYIHPLYRDDPRTAELYRKRLHAYAFTEQFAERGARFEARFFRQLASSRS